MGRGGYSPMSVELDFRRLSPVLSVGLHVQTLVGVLPVFHQAVDGEPIEGVVRVLEVENMIPAVLAALENSVVRSPVDRDVLVRFSVSLGDDALVVEAVRRQRGKEKKR